MNFSQNQISISNFKIIKNSNFNIIKISNIDITIPNCRVVVAVRATPRCGTLATRTPTPSRAPTRASRTRSRRSRPEMRPPAIGAAAAAEARSCPAHRLQVRFCVVALAITFHIFCFFQFYPFQFFFRLILLHF